MLSRLLQIISLIFSTIEDEASASGLRITSIFQNVANSILAAFQSTQGITFDSAFAANIESDKVAIQNYINALVAGKTEEEAFANTMREASAEAQNYVQNMNTATLSVDGYVARAKMAEVANLAQNKSLGNVRQIMNEYNSGMVNCGLNQQQFIDSVSKGNSVLGGYIAKVGVGNATMGGYVGTLISAKLATIGLRVATTALNAVIGMGIGLIVSLISSGISALIESIKESCKSTAEQLEDVNSRLQEISSTVKNTITDFQNLKTNVSDIAPRFAELAKGVDAFGNNISLTDKEYAEFIELNNKIAQLFPELNVGMDSNGNYMLSMSYSADTLTQSLNDLVEAERKAANEEIAKQIPDAIAEISKFDKLTQKDIDKYQNRIDLYKSSYEELSNLYSEEAEKALKESYGDNWESYRNTMVQTSTAAMTDIMQAWGDIGNSEDGDAWRAMIDNFVLDSGEIDWWKLINSDEFKNRIALFEREIDNAENAIKEKWKSLASYMNSWVQTDDTFNTLDDNMQKVVSKMVSNLDYGTEGLKNSEEIKKYITDNIIKPIQNATPEVQQMFNDLFSISTEDISVKDYIQQIKDKAKEISNNSDFSYDEILKNTGFDNIIKNYEKQADRIVDLLKDSVNNNTTKINELKDKIYDLTAADLDRVESLVIDYGLETWEEIQSALENKTFDEIFTIDVETEGIEKLTSAIKESTTATGLSAESIEKLKERYKDLEGFDASKLFEKTANGIHLNTKALRELEDEYNKQKKLEVDKKLEGLVEQYNKLTEEIDGTTDASEKAILSYQRQNVLDQINDTADLAAMYDGLTSSYKKWQDAQSGGEEGDMYDSMRSSLENIKELWEQGLVGTNEFRAYVDLLSGKDLSSASVDEIIAAYKELNATIQGTSYTAMSFLAEGEDGCMNFLNAVSQLDSSLVHMNGDGTWNIDLGFGDDEKIAQKLGVDVEFVQAILRKLSDYGFDINLDSIYSKLNLVQSEADKANQKLIDLGKTKVIFDFSGKDIETVNEQIEKAKEMFEQFKNKDGTVNLKLEGAEEAQGILATLIYQKQKLDEASILKVNTSEADSGVGEVIKKLQDFKSSYNNLEVQTEIGADTTEAKTEADGLLNEIKGMDAEILTTLGIDTTSLDTLNSTINSITPEVMVKAGLDASLIEGYQAEEHTANGTVIWDNNIKKVTDWANSLHTANGTVNWGNNTRSVKTNFYATGTINWSSGGKAQGTAFARGNWGTKNSGVALGGEVGQELLVRDGKFMTIGDDSAEFFSYRKGDIIFNAEQTKQIFENGKITNGKKRGTSYAEGTAFSEGSGRFTSGGKTNTTGGTSKNSSTSSSSSSDEKEPQEFDWIEVAIERIERAIDRLKTTATSTYKALKTKLGATASEITKVNQELALQEQAYNRYIQQANSVGLSSGLASQVRNGTIDINEYDEDTKKLIDDYKQWYEKALDCSDAIQELHENLASLYEDNFNNIKDDFDNQLGLLEHLTNTYKTGQEKLEAKGRLESTKYVSALKNVEQQNIGVMNKELNSLIQSFSEAMASGEIEEGSEAWYSMQQEINGVKEAIDEANLSLLEYDKTMREINWGYFDYMEDRISQITEESDFLIDLMSNSEMYDDNGQLTNEGLSTMGLHGVNYNVYMAQADDYAAEILKLDKEIANDPYNTDLIKRREELLGLQQDSIKAAEDEKQAIVSLVEDGIKVELDNLKELIDTYTKSLDSAKSLYDYQKKVADKTKEIQSLQKQLAAYSNDTSEETRTKIQKITVELQEKKEDLQETEYEQFISDTKKLLDELYIEYEQILNQRLDDVDQLICDMIDTVNANADTINTTITETADSVGYTVTSEMSNIWSNAVNSLDGVIAKYDKDYGEQLTSVNSVLAGIQSTVNAMVQESNKEAEKTVATTTTTTKPTTTTPKTTTPTTTTTTKTTTPTRSDKDNYGVALAIINGNYGWGTGDTRKKNLTAKGFDYNTVQGIVNKLIKEGYVNSGAWVGKYYGIKDLSPYHYNKYLHGGLIDYTGIAQVDGTPGNPELMLNSDDTRNFLELRDILRAMSSQALTMGSTFDFDAPSLIGISDVSSRLATLKGGVGNYGTNVGDISITIPIEHIDDYNDFVQQLQKDKQFEKLIQSMTIDRLAGGSSLAKNKYKW